MCALSDCGISAGHKQRVSVHTFPGASSQFRRLWINFVITTRKDFILQDSYHEIYRHHFEEHSFQDQHTWKVKVEAGIWVRRQLKEDAVPTSALCSFASCKCKPQTQLRCKEGLFDVAEGRPSGHVRVRRQLATTNNTVELLVVADQQAYRKYLTRNGDNDTAARNELLRYVAGLVREVNERFANLDAGGFFFRVSLADLVVLSLAESNATESNVVNGTVVNGDLALQAFQPQANALAANFSHDYAVLLTGYNVTRGNGSDADVRTFFGAVCSARRQGIVENFCVERTALALTKGIALSLGGRIDALANSCPDDFFVMSFNFNLPPREASGNPFTFSNCTGPEIRNYLDFFAFTSCVRTDNVSNPSPIDLAPLTATELGQTYDADTQCQHRFGNGSRLCRDLYGISSNRTYVDDLCREMLCLIPGNNTCQGTLPFDGTSCENQQWCQDGTCTSDPAAPTTVSDTCPQGDNPGSVCLKSLCGVGGSLYSNFICCATCASEVPAQNVTVSAVEGTVTLSVVDARTVSLSMSSSQKQSTLSLAGNASSAGTAAPTVSVVKPSSTQGPNSTLSVGTPTVPINVSTTQIPVTLSLVGTTPSRNTTLSQQNVTLSLVGTTPSRNTTPSQQNATLSLVGTTPSQQNVTLSLNGAMANRTETTTVPANSITQRPSTVSIIETGVTQTVSIVEPATTISVVAINTSALSLNTTTGPSVVGG